MENMAGLREALEEARLSDEALPQGDLRCGHQPDDLVENCRVCQEHFRRREAAAQQAALSGEQSEAVRLALAEERPNVFITGAAGTGKTRALHQVILALKEKYRQPAQELAICASTGNAACLINGTTLHSFLGCKLGKTPGDFNGMWNAQARLRSVRTLIIDEVSMLKSDFFDDASKMLRAIRKCEQPFGGIQLILSGDFLQLPPVVEGWGTPPPFCFKAKEWDLLKLHPVVLRHSFRQQASPAFLDILQRVRINEHTEEDIQALQATGQNHQGREGTMLTCKRKGAEEMNEKELAKLSDPIPYEADDRVEPEPGGDRDEKTRELNKRLESDIIQAPKKLSLAVGARVVLLRNIRLPERCIDGQIPLVNGTTGVVVGWAVQGGERLPEVEFSRRDGAEWRRETRVMERMEFTGEVCGVGRFYRRQLPLNLAWAVTVHKSQGMTLSAGGTVDLTDAFTAGHVYTALSRFSSLSDARVLGLSKDKIKASPEAAASAAAADTPPPAPARPLEVAPAGDASPNPQMEFVPPGRTKADRRIG